MNAHFRHNLFIQNAIHTTFGTTTISGLIVMNESLLRVVH